MHRGCVPLHHDSCRDSSVRRAVLGSRGEAGCGAGLLLHSSERRDDAAELGDRRVLVVGGGKSAQDTASAAVAAGATCITLALRRPHLLVPFRVSSLVSFCAPSGPSECSPLNSAQSKT